MKILLLFIGKCSKQESIDDVNKQTAASDASTQLHLYEPCYSLQTRPVRKGKF